MLSFAIFAFFVSAVYELLLLVVSFSPHLASRQQIVTPSQKSLNKLLSVVAAIETFH